RAKKRHGHWKCPCRGYWTLEAISPIELGVESDVRWLEVEALDVSAGLGGAVLAVHAAVFPFDAQRALVLDVVEGDDDLFEVDVAEADGAEVPVAASVGEAGVPAEDADGAVAVAPPYVLHVDVVDAIAEGADELDVVDA